jgi:amidohydrolase
MAEAKTGAQERLDRDRDALVDLSHRIHAHPELGYEEVRASGWLCEYLDSAGFDVEPGACDIPTAFVARKGSGPLHIGICAEYDCLPGIGHACGHNIIAAISAGAGAALAEVADDAGVTVTVLGTPAEEGGGGKIVMLERGAFDGIHAAMMVHPAPFDLVELPIIAVAHFDVHYTGKEAHASAFPELGINAADAITVAQTAIGLLRQHIRPSDRIHGIVTKGGEAPNIVPAHTSAKYYVRARTLAELDDLRPKVDHCLEAGALATGCTMEIAENMPPYAEMHHDPDLAQLYRKNAEAVGRSFADLGPLGEGAAASTDMGNVSLQIASIHPAIGIDSFPAVNHQPEFAAHCVTPSADKALYDGALAMAWTAIDAAADQRLEDRLVSTGVVPTK